ncbi:hypothetical protein CROQUDRAFT_54710 [Cronartium quercuum f. sp. fusiforme G11]|uniref:Uncharacterized protein n=1 Tax=Cronartium quercuum f. sp. fusiforme G11 TaxID=708437 RepID=A0A9P6N8L7_9BASI|nr:hypothetical protein CROQUDRAFT_54710 [Cronartium quercuum f. sp. fusiforme G11]
MEVNVCGPQGVLATPNGETAFFRAVIRYRPRGSHRHFAVMGMCKELERELNTSISSEDVWSLLRSCYNIDILNERDLEVLDDSDPSHLCKDSAGDRFSEFQLPIHPTTPSDLSFLSFINQRRLETIPSPVSSPDPLSFKHPRDQSRRMRSGSVGIAPIKIESRHADTITAEDGMESDLTEQEDLDEEDEDSVPEQPKSRRFSTRRPSVDTSNARGRGSGSGISSRGRGGRGRGRGRKKKVCL